MRWAIFFILVLLPSLSFAQGGEWGGPLRSLSKQERAELALLIYHLRIFDLDQPMHNTFWKMADSHEWSEEELPEVFDRLLGRDNVRKPYMFRAVLDAFENKKDTKSAEFQEYEAKLLEYQILDPEEIKESDEFIYNVAHGKPVVFEGLWGEPWAETPFTSYWAENYRANLAILDRYYETFLQLFDRNWKDK